MLVTRSFWLRFLACAAIWKRGRGDSSDNEFIFPGPPGPNGNYLANQDLSLGSVQDLVWKTNISGAYNISLWQGILDPLNAQEENSSICAGDNTAGQTMSCNWKVQLYNSNLSFSPVYFFWLNPGQSSSIQSHYFNITDSSSASISTTLSTASSTPTPSSSSSPSSTTASALPTSSTSAASNSNKEALSVGLGVGLGVGIPLVLLAGILAGIMIVRQRRRGSPGNDADLDPKPSYTSRRADGWTTSMLKPFAREETQALQPDGAAELDVDEAKHPAWSRGEAGPYEMTAEQGPRELP